MTRLVFCLFLLLGATGCGILNPYHENFDCRASNTGGRCVNSMQAYADAKHEEGTDNVMPTPSILREQGILSGATYQREGYQDSLYQQLSDLIRQPKTPVRVPPKIMRVLFVPYRGTGGELFMPRYVFLEMDQGKWVLDGNLVEPER